MDDFKRIGIKKSNKEETEEEKKNKIMDWLWGTEEKRRVLSLLKGKREKKQLKDEKEVP
jgi:hypothetical protein